MCFCCFFKDLVCEIRWLELSRARAESELSRVARALAADHRALAAAPPPPPPPHTHTHTHSHPSNQRTQAKPSQDDRKQGQTKPSNRGSDWNMSCRPPSTPNVIKSTSLLWGTIQKYENERFAQFPLSRGNSGFFNKFIEVKQKLAAGGKLFPKSKV